MMQNYFIAGTDSGVGKTSVTCALLRDLCARGIDAMGYKPVACGERTEARDIRTATGQSTYKLELINPVYLRTMAEPVMAAELERKPIALPELLQGYEALASAHQMVLVDGCGGWETPLASGLSMADLAASLGLPVLLVVNNRPGAASLASLTVRAIRERGLTVAGIILNHIGEEWSTTSVTNGHVIAELTGAPVLAELIHGQDYMDSEAVLG
ncbi:MAG: dethiobiotin synthase [Akkermansia sp.]|nr:dethiobiotin synthase [Akkermansia sp.]